MRRSNGFILGAILILLAFMGTGNTNWQMPTYVKIVAGVVLVGYGILRVVQYRNEKRK